MTESTESGTAPAKVRKPRQPREKKVVAAPRAPLALPKPTTSNGSANATLQGTVEKKFSRIVLRNKTGADIAVIHSTKEGDKELSPGSATILFVYTLIDAVLAGQGSGPDGSAMYVQDNWQKFVGYWGDQAKSHILVCEPAGRAGAQGYAGSLEQFFGIASAKAALVRQSIKTFGAAKPHIRTKDAKPEVIEVRL